MSTTVFVARDGCRRRLPAAGVVSANVSAYQSTRSQKDRLAASYADVAPEGRSANRSLSTVEPVCGTPKWKLENGAQRPGPKPAPRTL
jgi:hypothetical protein